MTYLLDSSAVLALLFGEPGGERVRALLEAGEAATCISVITLFEASMAIHHLTGDQEATDRAMNGLRVAVSSVMSVDERIVERAISLRRASSVKIAIADSIIAATASVYGATLVHRDPHFQALDGLGLSIEMLAPKD